MKVRIILRNVLAVLIMAGAVTFAIREFAKSRQEFSADRYQVNQLQNREKQIKEAGINNSILRIRIRALHSDTKAINSLVRQRMGLMRKDETYIPPSEL